MMKHATTRELYDYWQRIRGSQPAPGRSAVKPGEIRGILPNTFILEATQRRSFPFRLAGTKVCGLYGREVGGTDFLDLWDLDGRESVARHAAAVSDNAMAAVITAVSSNARGQTLACELLLLPLRHTGPGYGRLLGSLAPLDPPYWLGSEKVVAQTVADVKLIWPDAKPRMREPGLEAGVPAPIVGESPLDALPSPTRAGRQRGHLFVVDGGRDSVANPCGPNGRPRRHG
jgi:hypothetical protein